jgi:hypothetical protein
MLARVPPATMQLRDESDPASAKLSLGAAEVRGMIDAGVAQSEIVRQLVETGAWSKAGAAEIIRFMVSGPDALLKASLTLPNHRSRTQFD